jgi:phage/conjugal plasmid C-4 type zinc finger TraR family protein
MAMKDNDLTLYTVPDPVDFASNLTDVETARIVARHQRMMQDSLNVSQERNDDGLIVCSDCATVIPANRLKAVPHATQCIDCKQLEERDERRT